VVPLRHGAGVKRKVVEALREGLPLVTTPVGAQGLPGVSAVAAVCGTAETIAAAIVAVLEDDGLSADRSAAGIAYARAHFSEAKLQMSLYRAMGMRDAMSRAPVPLFAGLGREANRRGERSETGEGSPRTTTATRVVTLTRGAGAPRPYRRRASDVDAADDDAAYAEPALAPEGAQHGKALVQVGEQVGDVLQADVQPHQRAGKLGTTGGSGDEAAGR
jgi:hypothetical protein